MLALSDANRINIYTPPMPQPRQISDRAALLSWAAWRMDRRRWSTFDEWAKENLSQPLNPRWVDSRVKQVRDPTGAGGRPPNEPRDGSNDVFFVETRADEVGLALDRHLLRVSPARAEDRERLLAGLNATEGIRQVIQLGDGEVMAVVLSRNASEARQTLSDVQALVPEVVEMSPVLGESIEPRAATWAALANRQIDEDVVERRPARPKKRRGVRDAGGGAAREID